MFTSHLKKHSKNCTQHMTLDYVIYHCNTLQTGNIIIFSICRKAIAENCLVQGHTTIIWFGWDVNSNTSDSKINNLIHRSHSFYKIKSISLLQKNIPSLNSKDKNKISSVGLRLDSRIKWRHLEECLKYISFRQSL